MEGFTCTRLLPQLEDKIDPRQYTRKGHWTLDALLYKIISSDIRGGGHAVVRHVPRRFFAYFTKGFDLIDHTILIQELDVGDVTKKHGKYKNETVNSLQIN